MRSLNSLRLWASGTKDHAEPTHACGHVVSHGVDIFSLSLKMQVGNLIRECGNELTAAARCSSRDFWWPARFNTSELMLLMLSC
jgi:hypothetical protein